MIEDSTMHRVAALIEALDLPPTEAADLVRQTLDEDDDDQTQFDCNGGEYLVLTDDEADERAAEYIKESLWAFNPGFLAQHSSAPEEAFQAIADNGKCEDNNNTIEQMIDDIQDFIEDAISEDGRGHFMSSYDGDEIECADLFIYRTN